MERYKCQKCGVTYATSMGAVAADKRPTLPCRCGGTLEHVEGDHARIQPAVNVRVEAQVIKRT